MVLFFCRYVKRFILVPVYNEDSEILNSFLESLLKVAERYEARVVVIDDGTTRKTVKVSAKDRENVSVLRHMVNCGVGAAIQTGLEYVRQFDAELVVTVDGDGQHEAEDVAKVIDSLLNKEGDVISGSRFYPQQFSIFNFQFSNNKGIPLVRQVFNFLGNVVTWMLSGIWLSDSQSGMKGFSRRALGLLSIKSAGYEWCSEVARECSWYGLSIKEIPISVKYTAYSLSKGQSFSVGLETVFKLVVRALMR
jgi:UDP-N-acetylglucosamine---dolichyl-phosphate N-acetylglucosaminyltransferase